MMSRPPVHAQPEADVSVWTLTVPAGAVGFVAAICEGYENVLQLRTYVGAPPGEHVAWVAPAFEDVALKLFRELACRWGVKVDGPRRFGPADLTQGTGAAQRSSRN